MKYMVIGGNPFKGQNGTTTFTALNCLLVTNDLEEARQKMHDSYDDCSGLIEIFDTQTGDVTG